MVIHHSSSVWPSSPHYRSDQLLPSGTRHKTCLSEQFALFRLIQEGGWVSAPNTQKELSIPNYDGFHQKPWRRFLNVFRCETSVGTLPPHLFVNLLDVDHFNLNLIQLNWHNQYLIIIIISKIDHLHLTSDIWSSSHNQTWLARADLRRDPMQLISLWSPW